MLYKKVIFLTGGANGIGWECAKAYAQAGATICIADKEPLKEGQLAKLNGKNHLYLSCDVADEEQVMNSIELVINLRGRLDAIHNNAGIGNPAKPLHTTTLDEWQALMRINIQSIFFTTKYGIEHLKKTKGCILNTGSVVGSIGQENHAAYVATKGAVHALTKAMALDYAPSGIRVNAIAPAAINTPMLDTWIKQQTDPNSVLDYLNHLQPLGTMPAGDVIADAAAFLLSDAARFITGCILPVSGGAELGYRTLK